MERACAAVCFLQNLGTMGCLTTLHDTFLGESNGDHSCKLCPEYPVLAIRPECPPRGKSCLIYRTDDGLISPVITAPSRLPGSALVRP
eukprot:2494105-Rhodomonas_salina.1